MVAVRGLARGLHRGLWAGLLLAVCWTASVLVPLRLVADSYLRSHNPDKSSDVANESSQQSSSAAEPVWNPSERGYFSSWPREARRLGKASSGAATRSILMWNRFYEEPNLGFPLPRGWSLSRAAPCHPKPCAFASRAALRARTPSAHAASHFDAVVVRMRDGRLPDGFPPPARSPRQRFVFFRLEPPQYSGRAPGLRGVFNWTMSYRLDSDVHFPYGEVVARPGARVPARGWLRPAAPPPSPPQVDALLRARPRPSTPPSRANGRRERAVVAWMVSRCESASRREDYVRRLQRHLPVDVFGRCGSGYWPRNNTMGFYRMLARRYKFYLSFENSLCKDYVTEKFFSILHLPVVPVVLGGANYSAVAPPDSYIDARAFPSPRALARYLRYLAGAPRELAKFFWWKRYYRVVTAAPATLCRLCDALLKEPLPGQRSHEDVEAWWHEPGVCETPREDKDEDNENDDDDDDDEDDGASSAFFSEENMLQGYFEAATP